MIDLAQAIFLGLLRCAAFGAGIYIAKTVQNADVALAGIAMASTAAGFSVYDKIHVHLTTTPKGTL